MDQLNQQFFHINPRQARPYECLTYMFSATLVVSRPWMLYNGGIEVR